MSKPKRRKLVYLILSILFAAYAVIGFVPPYQDWKEWAVAWISGFLSGCYLNLWWRRQP